ncbi:hypothetical protein SISNIDRAFT_253237 [Sistotremastrum niveocremeum HHB9708]|uniref:Uncharacterized protein n=1 Tax=Sistotremastrum niveocremeum HHB9708 TaxID=1314777 RepID=A0A164PI51_9AGAM|nr:hypothetical protein SISNIDRAFT_253237 [Sistotremastrum niveocremeum HHB9708]
MMFLAGSGSGEPNSIDDEIPPALEEFIASQFAKWMPYLTAIYWSLFPGGIIALSYRFDFDNHLKAHPEVEDQIVQSLIKVDTPEVKNKRLALSAGFVIPPSSQIPRFSKPYSITATITWVIANLGAFAAFAPYNVIEVEEIYTLGAVVMWFSLPLMCLGIVGVALCRRELGALWAYEEVWKVEHTADKAGDATTAVPYVIEPYVDDGEKAEGLKTDIV